MTTRDIAQYLNPGLKYPGVPSAAHPEGSVYEVPSPSMKVGLHLVALHSLAVKSVAGIELSEDDLGSLDMDDDQEKDFLQMVLGPAYKRMLADGVPWTMVQSIGRDAFLCFASTPQVADTVLQGEAAARDASTGVTGPRTAGSNSRRASTPTRARSRGKGSTPPRTRSSTSPTAPEQPATAEAV